MRENRSSWDIRYDDRIPNQATTGIVTPVNAQIVIFHVQIATARTELSKGIGSCRLILQQFREYEWYEAFLAEFRTAVSRG